MPLQYHYDKLAEQMVEVLFDSHLDLDRFLPALHQAMLSRVKDIVTSGGDYEAEDLNWAANQEREAKLSLQGLTDAYNELYVADRYALPSDDATTIAHIRAAMATIQNLKQRMVA